MGLEVLKKANRSAFVVVPAAAADVDLYPLSSICILQLSCWEKDFHQYLHNSAS